jgi:NAD(P)-dependent dehydrogenase (short-subunit alcohol dehydrogenase family)
VLDTNLLGVWRIAQAFMPLLASTTDGAQTLICSTSLAAHSTDSALTPIAYNVSKLACCRLIEHIAADHAREGICAYALYVWLIYPFYPNPNPLPPYPPP